jgi:hypothetical protein
MEDTTEGSLLDMQVDYDGGHTLGDTVRWSRFISIVWFCVVGLLVILALILIPSGRAIFSLYSSLIPGIEDMTALIVGIVLLIAAVLGFLSWMLFRFATLTRKAMQTQDQALFNRGLNALRIYFTISGVIALLGLLINILKLPKLF